MTYQKSVELFRLVILPLVKSRAEQDHQVNSEARREAWDAWRLALLQDGTIRANQYHTWGNPL